MNSASDSDLAGASDARSEAGASKEILLRWNSATADANLSLQTYAFKVHHQPTRTTRQTRRPEMEAGSQAVDTRRR